MKLINEDTMRARQLTLAEAEKLRTAMQAGNVLDEFGDVLDWDDARDRDGDICVEQGGYENCCKAAGIK